ncbi:uncharacterized protein [Triticum aestivum]|uniref:uncharacterized protein n=1 Tax=Triticum aestivum TaxID=4565 RepID=UPI001D01CE74|nr:uncharacterized protein LOC123169630 [Triticum aestivum]
MDKLSYHSNISDLSSNKEKHNRSKPGVQSRISKVNVLGQDAYHQECCYSAERQKENTNPVVPHNYGVHQDQLYAAQNKELRKQELNEVQIGNQSCKMMNELLAPEGFPQSYTQLMKQMTLMSHLQSDNMTIPITSFTSLLTTSMDDQIQYQAAIKMKKQMKVHL